MSLVKWICRERGILPWQPVAAMRTADGGWPPGDVGCVQILREGPKVLIRFDGQNFGQWHCEELLDELDGLEGFVDRYGFRIWTESGGLKRCVTHTTHSAVEARRYVRTVTAVLGVIDSAVTLKVTPVRFDRLLMKHGRRFDEVVAAWLLDRRIDSPALNRLLQTEHGKLDQGLKIIRRDGDRFVFDAYRQAMVNRGVWCQSVSRPGVDLSVLDDRQLAQSLGASVTTVTRTDEPLTEIVRGVFSEVNGAWLTEFYRLSLPLAGQRSGASDSVLVVTQW